jgi:hypothetical protein
MTDVVTRFRFLVADDTSIYGVTAAGALVWHPGWTETSTPPTLDAGRQIGVGWADFAHLVAGGDGILYTLTSTGELRWYRDEHRDGSNAPDGSTGWAPGSGVTIRAGLPAFTHVLRGRDGVLYAITPAGELLWYKDVARDGSNASDGTSGWADGSGNQIGTGWSGFRHVVSGGGGVIYAVTEKGDLLWYRDDAQDGTNGPDASSGWAPRSGSRIGRGWDFFLHLLAADDGVLLTCAAREVGPCLRRYRGQAARRHQRRRRRRLGGRGRRVQVGLAGCGGRGLLLATCGRGRRDDPVPHLVDDAGHGDGHLRAAGRAGTEAGLRGLTGPGVRLRLPAGR